MGRKRWMGEIPQLQAHSDKRTRGAKAYLRATRSRSNREGRRRRGGSRRRGMGGTRGRRGEEGAGITD